MVRHHKNMFIRVKKIKNQNYAYLVNSKYTEKGVRQKIVKYLGKVIELKKNEKKEIKKYSHLTPKQLIHELVLLELKNHGFKKNKDIFKLKKFIYNPKEHSFSSRNKNIVLKLNNEFMCQHTISHLLNFEYNGDEEQIGLALAKAVVSSGLTIPKEAFIYLFEKVYKDEKAKLY